MNFAASRACRSVPRFALTSQLHYADDANVVDGTNTGIHQTEKTAPGRWLAAIRRVQLLLCATPFLRVAAMMALPGRLLTGSRNVAGD